MEGETPGVCPEDTSNVCVLMRYSVGELEDTRRDVQY